MGMYTELVMAAELKKDVPDYIIRALRVMLGTEELGDKPLPTSPLFGTPRWDIMLRCSSYYFPPGFSESSLTWDDITETFFLTIRSSFKNYDGEIDKFLDWIRPYVNDYGDSEFLGYYRYEEAEHPTLIYSNGVKDLNTPAQVVAVEEESTVIRLRRRF